MSTPDEYRSQQRALVRLVRQGQLTTTEALWRLERLGAARRSPRPQAHRRGMGTGLAVPQARL